MANLFDFDTSASNALFGGAAAEGAFGFPEARPRAGLRVAQGAVQQAAQQLEARRPSPPSVKVTPPVLGYNKETDTLYSGGKTFSGSNLSEMDSYDKAGFFDYDNKAKLPAGFAPVPATSVRNWVAKRAQDRGAMSAIGEGFEQAGRGIGDIGGMALKAGAMWAPEGSMVERGLGAAGEWVNSSSDATPDVLGRNPVSEYMIKGSRALAPSVGGMAATIAAPVAGTAAVGGIFGSAQAWDTYQKGLAAGLSPEDAKAAAIKTGAIEGIGESVFDRIGGKFLLGAGKVTSGILKGAAPTSHATRVAMDLLANAGMQSGAEYAQGYGQAAVEKAAGISQEDPHEVGMEGFKTGLGLSALLSPLGIASGAMNRPVAPAPAPAPKLPLDLGDTSGAPPTPPAAPYDYQGAIQFPLEERVPFVAPMQEGFVPLPAPGSQIPLGVPGAQTDLFDPLMEGPNEMVAPGQETAGQSPDTATRDMFDKTPSALVRTEYDAKTLLGRLYQGPEFTPKKDGTPSKVRAPLFRQANRLAQMLSDVLGKPEAVQRLLLDLERGKITASPEMAEAAAEVVAQFDAQMAQTENLDGRPPFELQGQTPADLDALNAREAWAAGPPAQPAPVSPDQTQMFSPKGNPTRTAVSAARSDNRPPFSLQGQTPADLTALNAREQWIAGPQAAPAAAPDGQTQLFSPKGNPTQAALTARGPEPTPTPAPVKPPVAPKRAKLKLPKDAAPAPVVNQKPAPVADKPKRAKLKLPKDGAPPAVAAQETNRDLTEGVREAPSANKALQAGAKQAQDLTPAQERTIKTLDKAYDEGQIELDEKVALEKQVRLDEAAIPHVRAQLHKMAVSNVGERAAKYRTPQQAKGLPLARVKRVVAAIASKIKGLVDVVVLESVTEFDPSQTPGSRAGAFRDGKVYIFADGVVSPLDVAKTLFHELFHRGVLRKVDPKAYAAKMMEFYRTIPEVRASADAWIKTADGVKAVEENGREKATQSAVEETLAALAESETTPASVVRKIANWIADVLQKLGLPGAQFIRRMGVTEVRQFVQDALAAGVEGGGPGGGAMFRTVGEAAVSTAQDAAQRMSDVLKYDVVGSVRRGNLATAFLRDLGHRYEKKFKRVQDYVTLVFTQGDTAAKLQDKASDVQDALNALPSEDKKAVLDFMGRVTYAGVSIEGSNTHLGKDADAIAQPFLDEFNSFTDKQQEAYRMSRDVLKANWTTRGKLLSKLADEIYNPLIQEAERTGNVQKTNVLRRERAQYVEDIHARLNAMKGDYFPLMRFGDWMLIRKSDKFTQTDDAASTAHAELNTLMDKYDTKSAEERKALQELNKALKAAGQEEIGDFTPEEQAEIDAARKKARKLDAEVEAMKSSEDDYYMAQYDAESQARAAERELPGSYVSMRKDFSRELNPMTRALLNRVEESLDTTLRGKGNVTAMRDAKKALYETFLHSLPEFSALKRQLGRKNVAGYHHDMQRSLAANMLRDSFFLSRLQHGDELDSALNSVRAEADAAAKAGQADATKMQEVARELERRRVAEMRYVETPWQDRATALTYVMLLGVSPAYLIANLLQPLMISAPFMRARHNTLPTATAMWRAWKDVSKMVGSSLKGSRFSGEIDYKGASGLSAQDIDMLDRLQARRLLTVTLTRDLTSVSEGETGSKLTRYIGLPGHHAEVINRIGTALAAFRLELAKNGGDVEAATKYAERVVDNTHLDYSTENAPYWMKPGVVPLGKVLFQFKKYTLGMLMLYARTFAAMAGKDVDARKEARKTLIGLGVTHAAMAGALGLPFVGSFMDIANVIQAAFGDDEPWDPEVELRNWLRDVTGSQEAADAMAKGLPTLLGADLSQKVGASNLLKPFGMMRDNKEGRELWLEFLGTAGGPFLGGIMPRLAEGFKHAANGDMIRATEQFLPKFAADPIKAARQSVEGVRTAAGDTLYSKYTLGDALVAGAGFQANAVANAYAANAAVQEYRKEFNDRRTRIQRAWADAKPADRKDVLKDMAEYNDSARKFKMPPLTQGDLYRYLNKRNQRNAGIEATGSPLTGREQMTGLGQVARFAR